MKTWTQENDFLIFFKLGYSPLEFNSTKKIQQNLKTEAMNFELSFLETFSPQSLSSLRKGAVSWQSSSFVVYFANFSPSIAMELKVSKEITGKWQNQRSETNKYVSWALFLKFQAAGINFEKLLGWTVFKNPNFKIRFSLLEFCPSVASVVSGMLFKPSFKVLSGYFYVSLNLIRAFCNFLIGLNFVTQLL